MLQDEALIGFLLMVTLLPVPLWLVSAPLVEKSVTAGAGVSKSLPSGAQSMAVSAAFGTLQIPGRRVRWAQCQPSCHVSEQG